MYGSGELSPQGSSQKPRMQTGNSSQRSTRPSARRWSDAAPRPQLHAGTAPQNLPYEIPRARLREIDFAIAHCQSGTGALVWIGEPGMGKSALLAHAAAEAETHGSRVIRVPSHQFPANGSTPIGLEYIFEQLIALCPTLDRDAENLAYASLENLDHNSPRQHIAQVTRELTDLIAQASRRRAIVFVIDDLEHVDEVTSRTLISAVAERRAAASLLITASDLDMVRSLPYEVERRPLGPITNSDALFMLQESLETTVAPHVIQILNEHVSGAPTALVETAQSLSSAQLAGMSQLPDPLPVAASTHRAVSKDLIGLPASEREVLLTAAVAISDRTDLFLSAIDRDIDELLSSPASRHLRLVAGHVKIADPRIRAVIHSDASVGERTAVHQRLAQVHREAGSEITALWHHALAALTGDTTLSDKLMKVAERMLELGDASWAQRVAREGLSHATGLARARAMAVAGRAALHAGHISDAVGLLREATRILPEDEARSVSAALIAAVTLSTGQVPEEIVQKAKNDPHSKQLAVIFHTERGQRNAAAKIIEELAESGAIGSRGTKNAAERAEIELNDNRLQLLRTLHQTLGERPDAGLHSPTPDVNDPLLMVGGRILRALALIRTGAMAEARRVITSALSEMSPTTTSSWEPEFHNGTNHDFAITPLLESYLHVMDILIEYAAGNIAGAQKSLEQAAYSLPMALPCAGLVCVIAGRLSTLRTGEVDELATVLERLVPVPLAPTIRAEILANRAFSHLVSGETREAETLMDMTRKDHSSAIPLTARPNYFDVLELIALPPAASHEMVVPDTEMLGEVPIIEVETDDVDALDMALRHLIRGRQSAAAAAPAEAAEYLMRSAMLFEELGAFAGAQLATSWAEQVARGAGLKPPLVPGVNSRSAVESSLNAAAASPATRSAPDGANIANSGLPRWATLLTEREREVAQIIASGATNREAAADLYVSVRTIEVHLTSIFRKLEIGSRVELAVVVSHAPLE